MRNTVSPRQLQSELRLAAGYVELLGEQTDQVLAVHSEHVLDALLHFLEFNVDNLLLANSTQINLAHQGDMHRSIREAYAHVFVNFRDADTLTELSRFCSLLSRHCRTTDLITPLLELLGTTGLEKEAVFVLTLFGPRLPQAEALFLVQSLLDSAHWSVTFKAHQLTYNSHYVLYQMLVLEALQTILLAFPALQEEAIQVILFPVLEKLACPLRIVSETAWALLHSLAAQTQGTVVQLIETNSDYVVDKIVHRFNYLELYPETPLLVQGLLAHCEGPILPYLEDTLESSIRALDRFSTQPLNFLSLFHTLLTLLHKTHPAPTGLREDEFDTQEVEDGEDNRPAGLPPQYFDWVKRIIDIARNYLPYTHLRTRILAIELLQLGFTWMTHYPQDLPPASYPLWSSFMMLLASGDAVVETKTTQLLASLVSVLPRLLTSRFAELWDKLQPIVSRRRGTSDQKQAAVLPSLTPRQPWLRCWLF
jgi:hypothetical protein